jgi:hypothetical protein
MNPMTAKKSLQKCAQWASGRDERSGEAAIGGDSIVGGSLITPFAPKPAGTELRAATQARKAAGKPRSSEPLTAFLRGFSDVSGFSLSESQEIWESLSAQLGSNARRSIEGEGWASGAFCAFIYEQHRHRTHEQ